MNKLLFLIFLSLSTFEAKASDIEDDSSHHHIIACTRPINKDKNLPAFAEHCYVKLVRGTSVVDSRGYFQDVGSVQEDNIFVGTCTMVKRNASIEDWMKITDSYDKHTPENYSLMSNNCCSVAKEALKLITANVPRNITTANSSIGTK